MKICAAIMLYEKIDGEDLIAQTVTVVFEVDEGDEEPDIKAKADIHISNDIEQSEKIKGFDFVEFGFAVREVPEGYVQ